jgi:tRNA-binding protein
MSPAPVKPLFDPKLLEQLDVRVGTIEAVHDVTGSDKLVQLRIQFGDHTRTIVAGMKQERTDPREIEGKQALFVVNFQRRHAPARSLPCSHEASALQIHPPQK